MSTISLIWMCKWPDDEYPEATGVCYYGKSKEECKKEFFKQIWSQFLEDNTYGNRCDICYDSPITVDTNKSDFSGKDETEFENQAWEHLQKGHFHMYPIVYYLNTD